MARSGSKPGALGRKTPNKTAPAAKRVEKDETVPTAREPSLKLQQRCLNIFCEAFRPGTDDIAILQEVKGHLYRRDFAAAFGKDEYLRVYASRWSSSRALAYLNVFNGVDRQIDKANSQDGADDGQREPLRVICLGGGAGSELVGLAGCLGARRNGTPPKRTDRLHLDLVDMANWSFVVQQLKQGVMTPPELSKYASQAKKDANIALLEPDALTATFHQIDVLDPELQLHSDLKELLTGADLVTFMFTLNELYSTSIPKTQDLLVRATTAMRPGSHLLVVDSPGSYSTLAIDGTERKYPMHWLLDFTLLGGDGGQGNGKWEKLMTDESRWFRLPDGLEYPIELENMRYQIHLYRRLSDEGG